MKHLKSSSSDLRRLFEHAITVREIAEPLTSFDADRDSQTIRAFMEARNFDVVGLREDGKLVGYVRCGHLRDGPAGSCITRFGKGDSLPEGEPLAAAIRSLKNRSEVFVTVLGQVGGIVTKGDLQKAPVRLWLFGMITLIEMHMLRLARDRFPDGGWVSLLSPGRVEAAEMIFAARKQRNEEADCCDFSDCLQICDKATILLKDRELAERLGFPSRRIGQRFFAKLESLRNALAHANDIVKGRWPALGDLAEEADVLLARLESAPPRAGR